VEHRVITQEAPGLGDAHAGTVAAAVAASVAAVSAVATAGVASRSDVAGDVPAINGRMSSLLHPARYSCH
jgi:hypothetical protein